VTVYLYGLVLGRSAHLVPAHITGVASTVLRVVHCGEQGLSALVSTVDAPPRRTSLDDVRAHDHALQSVVHHGSTAAAVRFGQVFASDEDIRHHLGEQGPRLVRVLEEYDGCVEMRLLVADTETDSDTDTETETDPEAGPGRAYLENLRHATNQPLQGLALRAALGPVVRAERVERLGARGAVFSHLIARDDEPVYRDVVSTIPAIAKARVVGPLPLYSFTSSAE
jgi:hypothetical protein